MQLCHNGLGNGNTVRMFTNNGYLSFLLKTSSRNDPLLCLFLQSLVLPPFPFCIHANAPCTPPLSRVGSIASIASDPQRKGSPGARFAGLSLITSFLLRCGRTRQHPSRLNLSTMVWYNVRSGRSTSTGGVVFGGITSDLRFF
jgi:hypothetical protein